MDVSSEELFLKLLVNTITEEELKKTPKNTTKFIGKINTHSFCISRVLKLSNSFIPKIKGDFEGDKLEVTYTLFPTTKYFFIFWSVLLIIGSIISFFSNNENIYSLLFLVAFLINYMVMLINFKKEVLISKKQLQELLKS